MGHSRPLFSLFSSFQYTVDRKQLFNINKFLLMTGFEPQTSGIGSDRSTNWATQPLPIKCEYSYLPKSVKDNSEIKVDFDLFLFLFGTALIVKSCFSQKTWNFCFVNSAAASVALSPSPVSLSFSSYAFYVYVSPTWLQCDDLLHFGQL